MTRKVTNKLLEMMDEGAIDSKQLVKSCLVYMSEDDVADMALSEGYTDEDEDEDECTCDLPGGLHSDACPVEA